MSHGRRSRALRAGISAALTVLAVLGLVLVGNGTASAASRWRIVLVNEGLPANAGSVKLDFPRDPQTGLGGSFACFAFPDFRPVRSIETRTFAFANQGFHVYVHAGRTCGGTALLTGRQYRFTADQDVRETGRDRPLIEVWANRTAHNFTSSVIIS